MSWATEDDEHIRLLRAVKRHHLDEADDPFPGLDAFRADGGDPAEGVSLYNMALCPDAETAFVHAEKYHRTSPLGFIAVTVGECLEVGGKVRFDHDEDDEELQFHASLYLSEDKSTRTAQKEQLVFFAASYGWIYQQLA